MHTPDSTENNNNGKLFFHAAAGAIAGCIARFCTGPLDVIKIRFQVQLEPITHSVGQAAHARHVSKYTGLKQAFKTILKEEGVQGLWRGTVPGLLLTVPYTAVQFVALQQCKAFATKMGLSDHPSAAPLVSFGSGAVAGAAATIASYPFDLLRTTLAAQGEPKVYHTMWEAAKGICKEQGVVGLYRGLNITLIEIIPYAALQFGLYDAFNLLWNEARLESARALKQDESLLKHDTQLQHFVCGLAAGMAAKMASHPLDVAKKRYQIAGLQRSLRYGARVEAGFAMSSLKDSLVLIYRTEGLRGLWKGSIPSIVKAAPSAAITFTAYDAALAWLLLLAKQKDKIAAQDGS